MLFAECIGGLAGDSSFFVPKRVSGERRAKERNIIRNSGVMKTGKDEENLRRKKTRNTPHPLLFSFMSVFCLFYIYSDGAVTEVVVS